MIKPKVHFESVIFGLIKPLCRLYVDTESEFELFTTENRKLVTCKKCLKKLGKK